MKRKYENYSNNVGSENFATLFFPWDQECVRQATVYVGGRVRDLVKREGQVRVQHCRRVYCSGAQWSP